MSDDAQPLPARIPASGTFFPDDHFERLAGSKIRSQARGQEVTNELADGRTGTYYLEPAPGGDGTWILRP